MMKYQEPWREQNPSKGFWAGISILAFIFGFVVMIIVAINTASKDHDRLRENLRSVCYADYMPETQGRIDCLNRIP